MAYSETSDSYQGMYNQSFPERCWSPNGKMMSFTTPCKSSVQSYALSLGTLINFSFVFKQASINYCFCRLFSNLQTPFAWRLYWSRNPRRFGGFDTCLRCVVDPTRSSFHRSCQSRQNSRGAYWMEVPFQEQRTTAGSFSCDGFALFQASVWRHGIRSSLY